MGEIIDENEEQPTDNPEATDTVVLSDEDDEPPVPYSSIAGKPVSGKWVVLSMFAIVIGVVWGANVWLSPAQKKLNAVYRKQKKLDVCMASMKSNRMLTTRAKEDFCKRQAARRKSNAAASSKLAPSPAPTPTKVNRQATAP